MSSELILIVIVCTVIFASVVIFAVTNSKIKEEMKQQKLKDEAKKQQEQLKTQESVNKSYAEKTKKVLDETSSRVDAYLESVIVKDSEPLKEKHQQTSTSVKEINKHFNLIENSILFEDSSLSNQQEIAKEHLNDDNLFGEDFNNQANNVSDILNDLDINDYQSAYNTKSISHNLFGDKMIDRLENPVANEYKNLSKQLKVLIISNALNKKE